MRTFLVVMALATSLWTATAHAQGPMMGGPMHGGGGSEPGMLLPMLIHKVGLTAAQRQQMRTILDNHRAKFQALFPQLRSAQQALDAKLVSTAPVHLDDLAPQIQQIADFRKQLMLEGAGIALEVRALLTPEQLARAADLHTQMAALRDQMQKLMGEPSMGPPPIDE
jgi:Spy/CpxP family protein refolding chaperone